VLFAVGSLAGGGSERQVVALLKHLDRARFEPLLYLVTRGGELLGDVPPDVPIFAGSDAGAVPKLYWPGRRFRLQSRHLRGVLTAQRVDVVYDRTYFMTLIAGEATRRLAIPRISAVVSNPERDVARTAQRFVWLKRRLLRRCYRRAFRVVANSEELRRLTIRCYGLPESQVAVIPNLLDLDEIDRLAAAEPPPWPSDRFHIVTAGRLQPEKGQRDLVAAVAELVQRRNLSAIHLHILGTGPLESELRDMIAQRGLAGHVSLHGYVDNPFAYFRRAELFCLPSLYEGLPNALIEAMACGTPVLAADCPTGPRELLAGGKYGTLVPPGDSAALANAIADAVARRAEWLARVEPARQSVAERFSPAAAVRPLEELFLAACGKTIPLTLPTKLIE
jgi:glycosyltransferase involved in cell wall biosynthesis